jgi:SAM-dependent methyltransferase
MPEAHHTEGYVTDIDYTWGAYEVQNPRNLAALTVLAGLEPPDLAAPFTYLDLGCGNGLTVSLLAAAYPQARFLGVDLNPRHVENARGFAAAAGLTNVTFVAASFHEALALDLPACDFVALHGVYTWVPRAVREDVLALLRALVKPDGLAYIAYNSMPGWAALEPMRRLMNVYASVVPGTTVEKAVNALAYLRLLQKNGAAYFADSPAAQKMLDMLGELSPSYLAHEYFNEAWEPVYFGQMADDTARAGLGYLGSLPLWFNMLELVIPHELQPIFRTAPDRIAFESHKDFVTNQRFRVDVFTRRALPPPGPPRRDGLRRLRILGTVPLERQERKLRFPHFTMDLDHPVYEPLMRLATQAARTGEELLALPELAGFGAAAVLEAMQFALISHQFEVVRDQPRALPERFPPRIRLVVPAAAHALETFWRTESGIPIVSPVTGGITKVQLVEAILLRGHVAGVAEAGRAAWLVEQLDAIGRRLNGPDGPLEGAAATEAAEAACHNYATGFLPHLWRLGVVEAA